MIWFLPLFSVVLGGLVGSFLAELVIWVTNYLDKQSAKKHIQEQKKTKLPKEVNDYLVEKIERGGKKRDISYIKNRGVSNVIQESINGSVRTSFTIKENYNNMNIGLSSMSESSNTPIYRVPARDEMINIMVNEHRCDRVRLENMTDKKLETLYGELRGIKESSYIPSRTLFTRDEMINILVKEHQSDRVRLENMTDKKLETLYGELRGIKESSYIPSRTLFTRDEMINILVKEHQSDRVRLENMTDKKLETIYNVLRGANEKIVNKQEIIDILVKRHGYQKEWLVNKPIDKLQAMYEELKGTSYTPNIKEVDWILEDEESRKIFAGKYYNGEVVSMEEIQAQEIDPELQWELDNKEIVIL